MDARPSGPSELDDKRFSSGIIPMELANPIFDIQINYSGTTTYRYAFNDAESLWELALSRPRMCWPRPCRRSACFLALRA
jgi:hypothetical protein